MGWSRAELMAGFTLMSISMAVMAPFAGRLVERYGARMVITSGALLASSGLVLLSQMSNLWHYYAGYTIMGVGIAALNQVTASYVVSQWFYQRRGMALSVMSMGLLSGLVVYPPIFGAYVLPQLGWSNTYLTLAAIIVAVIVPLSLLVIRTKPSEMGLYPDGKDTLAVVNASATSAAAGSQGLALKMAIATSAFWVIAVYALFNHQHMGTILSQVPYLIDTGFSVGVAAASFSILSITQIFGVFFFGWLCDKKHVKLAMVIGNFFMALGILMLINISAKSPAWLIWLYAILMGFGTSSWLPTLSMLTSTTFGLHHYGSIFGMLSFFQILGAASGPLLAGYLYDITGNYHLAFIIILGLVLLSIPLVIAVRRPTSRV